MKIRAELHLGGPVAHVILVARPEEKVDHLSMKLAAFAMFHSFGPIVEPSSDHPSLQGLDLRPDVLVLDEGGDVKVWIECGTVSFNKLDKAVRRFPQARVVVLKSTWRDAERLRREMETEVRNSSRIEIWTWPEGSFRLWMSALEEKTELYGEVNERNFNVTINHTPYAVDLVAL